MTLKDEELDALLARLGQAELSADNGYSIDAETASDAAAMLRALRAALLLPWLDECGT